MFLQVKAPLPVNKKKILKGHTIYTSASLHSNQSAHGCIYPGIKKGTLRDKLVVINVPECVPFKIDNYCFSLGKQNGIIERKNNKYHVVKSCKVGV